MVLRKNWANQKYFMLTILQPTGKIIYNGEREWEAKCDCGNTCYVIPGRVKNGKIKSCGCLKSILAKQNKGARKFSPTISSARAVWRNGYKEIDFDFFYKTSQLACHYCGCMPYKIFNASSVYPKTDDFQKLNGNFTYNGLDRLDSNKKHTADNVVPCCSICNYMKRTLSYDEFLYRIRLIHININSPNFKKR